VRTILQSQATLATISAHPRGITFARACIRVEAAKAGTRIHAALITVRTRESGRAMRAFADFLGCIGSGVPLCCDHRATVTLLLIKTACVTVISLPVRVTATTSAGNGIENATLTFVGAKITGQAAIARPGVLTNTIARGGRNFATIGTEIILAVAGLAVIASPPRLACLATASGSIYLATVHAVVICALAGRAVVGHSS